MGSGTIRLVVNSKLLDAVGITLSEVFRSLAALTKQIVCGGFAKGHENTLALVRTSLYINLSNFLEGEGFLLFAYFFYFAKNLKAVRLADVDSFTFKKMF